MADENSRELGVNGGLLGQGSSLRDIGREGAVGSIDLSDNRSDRAGAPNKRKIKTEIIDPLERVIRPIVEGQVRGFAKEHPGVLNGVTWYKGKKHGVLATFVNSLSKRVVRDLVCEENRQRIEDAYFEIWEAEKKSAVEHYAAADDATAGRSTGLASVAPVELLTAGDGGLTGTRTGQPALPNPFHFANGEAS